MNTIKVIYYDWEDSNARNLEVLLEKKCASIYKIKSGLYLVYFDGTCKDLYNAIVDTSDSTHVLILDIDNSKESYWGYMETSVWEWLKEHLKQ